MITKEEFNSVWKDTTKEGILNQFYYEHIDLMKLQQENKQLKEKVVELTNSWNEQIKLTNQENLDCSKYAVENHHLKSILDEIRKYINNISYKDLEPIEVQVISKILDKVKE